MKKSILLFITMLISLVMTCNISCSKENDEEGNVFKPAPIKILCWDRIKAPTDNGKNVLWQSNNSFVASILDDGSIYGAHLGKTTLKAVGYDTTTVCEIEVVSNYDFMKEPNIEFGKHLSQYRWGLQENGADYDEVPLSEDNRYDFSYRTIMGKGFRSKDADRCRFKQAHLCIVGKNLLMTSFFLTLTNYTSTSEKEKIYDFYQERYEYIGDVNYNGEKIHKLVWMESGKPYMYVLMCNDYIKSYQTVNCMKVSTFYIPVSVYQKYGAESVAKFRENFIYDTIAKTEYMLDD